MTLRNARENCCQNGQSESILRSAKLQYLWNKLSSAQSLNKNRICDCYFQTFILRVAQCNCKTHVTWFVILILFWFQNFNCIFRENIADARCNCRERCTVPENIERGMRHVAEYGRAERGAHREQLQCGVEFADHGGRHSSRRHRYVPISYKRFRRRQRLVSYYKRRSDQYNISCDYKRR